MSCEGNYSTLVEARERNYRYQGGGIRIGSGERGLFTQSLVVGKVVIGVALIGP